jgi:hypothetical protein
MVSNYRTKEAKIKTAYNWLNETGNLNSTDQSYKDFTRDRTAIIEAHTEKGENTDEYLQEQMLHAIAASGIPTEKARLDAVEYHLFELRWPIATDEPAYRFAQDKIKLLYKKLNSLHSTLVIGSFYKDKNDRLAFQGRMFGLELVDDSDEALGQDLNGKDIVWMSTDSTEPRFAGWIGIDGASGCELTYRTSLASDLSTLWWKPVVKLANDVMGRHDWKYDVESMNCAIFVDEFIAEIVGTIERKKMAESKGKRKRGLDAGDSKKKARCSPQ